jgi:hypothetical protein
VPLNTIVYASTLNGNSAGARGGAVATTLRAADVAYPVTRLIDSTIAGNKAGTGAGGVDIFAPTGAQTGTIDNSILACNSTDATSGADFRIGGGVAPFEGSFSLIQNVSSAAVADNGGNIFGQNPLLAPLAANGGLTKTMALTPGSPAIDHGQTTFPTDQREFARPGSGDDMGALELQPSDTPQSAAPCDSHVGTPPSPQPPAPPTPPTGGAPTIGKVALSKVKASSTGVTFTVTCTSASCSGNAVLSAVERLSGEKLVGLAKIRHKRVRVGAKSYSLKAGQKKTIAVKLNSSGKKLLKKFKKLPVTLVVTQKGKAAAVKTAKVRIKRKR